MEKGISNRKNGKKNDCTKDKPFDPSVDMLVNDFDDERTLEEEEALASVEAEDPEVELTSLQKESNMPLEELLSLYGYCSENKENTISDEAGEETSNIDTLEPVEENHSTPSEEPSKLRILYELIPDSDQDAKVSRCKSHISEEEDYDYNPDEDELRKTIMVGNDYQARVPSGTLPRGSPCEHDEDTLLWNPAPMDSSNVEEYLQKVYVIKKPPLPCGTQLRDDEWALYLLHECGYNTEEALRRIGTEVETTPALQMNLLK